MHKPRIAHCRFYKGESLHNTLDKFDKVVTLAWNYDENTSILTYGGTVFKKKNKQDYWIKRLHKDEALTRFNCTPIRVYLTNSSNRLLTKIGLEWFIAENLIYKFGAYDHHKELDMCYNAEIKLGFLEKYDPRHCEKLETQQTQQKQGSYFLNFSLFFIGLGLGILTQTC